MSRDATTLRLEAAARQVRLDVLEMVVAAGSGHVDSSLSVADILAVLYFETLNVRPADPTWALRDRLVLSKGHAAPALYACLARREYFPVSELRSLRSFTSHLQGHPKTWTPGVDAPTGSLGQGLSLAAGLAWASSRLPEGDRWRVFAVLSDGELNEGQTWEAFMLAGHLGLSALTVVVDRNGLQYSGPTRSVLDVGDLERALVGLGWTCSTVDGHAVAELRAAFEVPRGPHAILATTVKGKGISFMEGDLAWHGKVPTRDQYLRARTELEAG